MVNWRENEKARIALTFACKDFHVCAAQKFLNAPGPSKRGIDRICPTWMQYIQWLVSLVVWVPWMFFSEQGVTVSITETFCGFRVFLSVQCDVKTMHSASCWEDCCSAIWKDTRLHWTWYTLCPRKKRSRFYFLNNSIKNEPTLIIFGTVNPEGTWH